MGQYRYAAVCVLPLSALVGMLLGGWWCWLGVGAYAALYVGWDQIGAYDEAPPPGEADAPYDALLLLPVPLVLLVWGAFLLNFAGLGGRTDGLAQWLGEIMPARSATARPGHLAGAFLSYVLSISAAGTSTAHELVHRVRSGTSLFAGRALLALILDASFPIEHVYGHHRNVGTREDPATARRGESVYRFVVRSTVDQYRAAWAFEQRRLLRRGQSIWSHHNRVFYGAAFIAMFAGVTAAVCGPLGLLVFLGAGLLGKASLEIINYVEHYGLIRVPGAHIRARHSWDTANPMSAAGMFNLSRHASHHLSSKPYWQLSLEPGAPRLPGGLFLSGLIALLPPLWFHKMGRRLARWDSEMASPDELALAAASKSPGSRLPEG